MKTDHATLALLIAFAAAGVGGLILWGGDPRPGVKWTVPPTVEKVEPKPVIEPGLSLSTSYTSDPMRDQVRNIDRRVLDTLAYVQLIEARTRGLQEIVETFLRERAAARGTNVFSLPPLSEGISSSIVTTPADQSGNPTPFRLKGGRDGDGRPEEGAQDSDMSREGTP